jgi:uncharacterized protein
MELEYYILRIFSGLTIGFLIGLTGIGGGSLLMPTLTTLLGIPVSSAIGTASLFSFITKIYAVLRHAKLKTIVKTPSILLLIGAIPTCIVSSNIVVTYSKNLGEDFQHNLKTFIAWVMVFCSIILIFNLYKKKKSDKSTPISQLEYTPARKFFSIILGIVIGFLVGTTSVGGGALVIPVLVIFFRLDGKDTVGTSILIAVILTLITSFIYSSGGECDIKTAIIMSGASFPGVFFGSKLTIKIPGIILETLIVFTLLLATTLMFI